MPDLVFYTDENVQKSLVEALRKREISVVRCQDVDMLEASDEEHLQYATEHGYIVLSRDDDFLRLNKDWWEEEQLHAGIVYVGPKQADNIGEIVRYIVNLNQTKSPEDMRGWVEFFT